MGLIVISCPLNRILRRSNPVDRKYKFSWDHLGDIAKGRPNLGFQTRLEVYRLAQFSLRDILERHVGTDKTDQIFHEAGRLAGREFYAKLLSSSDTFNAFVKQLQDKLREMGIGILRMEEADAAKGAFVLTVSEDLDCSGMPELGYEACTYDEGFIAGLLESYSGRPFKVREIDCWCTGDRTCRFSAEAVE
jgi:hypothetical protein